MITGRPAVGVLVPVGVVGQPGHDYNELLPIGNESGSVIERNGENIGVKETDNASQNIFDNQPASGAAKDSSYTQADFDYAIASRYVELEREYAKDNALGKDAAREISFIVMDDFELTPKEWESFLSRATAGNLFNRIRSEQELIPSPSQDK